MQKNTDRFSLFAGRVAIGCGQSAAFLGALLSMMIWLAVGASFDYSDEWKEWLAIYLASVTFMLVFLIQHTQNRDTLAVHIKLDELIRATRGAHTALLKVEDLSDEDLNRLSDKYKLMAETAREHVTRGGNDTHAPELSLAADLAETDVSPVA